MRVILATDGAIEADLAEAVCSKLPLPPGSMVTVAMAVHTSVPIGIGLIPEATLAADTWIGENQRIQRMVADQTLRRVHERIEQQGFQAEMALLDGDPAEQIERLAQEKDASLVVVGSGVTGSVTAMLLGSVSRHLVLHCGASVLVGKHFQEVPPEGSYQRIVEKEHLDALLAVDGSPGSDMGIQSLEAFPDPVFRKLFVLCVDNVPSWPIVRASDRTTGAQAVAELAAQRLQGCAAEVIPITSAGRPSAAIAHEAKTHDVDLIVLGANRHGTIERLLTGSCAYETATAAPCSVLIVRDVLPFG
ncbi:MAG: universal stress protein [Fimbriimonadaceae bacterium]|nr:universal stress protein [Fimbriimonadaceae bacterium]